MTKPNWPPDMTTEERRLAQIMRNVVDERISKAVDRLFYYLYACMGIIAVVSWLFLSFSALPW